MRTLIENLEFLVTVDRDDRVLRGASVVLENDRFADVGSAADVARRHPRASFTCVVDGRRYGMTPGFIDSHVHLGETLKPGVMP
jgi:cytosine/adenosine deaminase-related metal-dependent hydrolase